MCEVNPFLHPEIIKCDKDFSHCKKYPNNIDCQLFPEACLCEECSCNKFKYEKDR